MDSFRRHSFFSVVALQQFFTELLADDKIGIHPWRDWDGKVILSH